MDLSSSSRKTWTRIKRVRVVGPLWGLVQASIMIPATLLVIATITPAEFHFGQPAGQADVVLTLGLAFLFGYVLADIGATVKALLVSQFVSTVVFLIVLNGTLGWAISNDFDFVAWSILLYTVGLLIISFSVGLIGSLAGSFLGDYRKNRI